MNKSNIFFYSNEVKGPFNRLLKKICGEFLGNSENTKNLKYDNFINTFRYTFEIKVGFLILVL